MVQSIAMGGLGGPLGIAAVATGAITLGLIAWGISWWVTRGDDDDDDPDPPADE